jgi:hypothetical protein
VTFWLRGERPPLLRHKGRNLAARLAADVVKEALHMARDRLGLPNPKTFVRDLNGRTLQVTENEVAHARQIFTHGGNDALVPHGLHAAEHMPLQTFIDIIRGLLDQQLRHASPRAMDSPLMRRRALPVGAPPLQLLFLDHSPLVPAHLVRGNAGRQFRS